MGHNVLLWVCQSWDWHTLDCCSQLQENLQKEVTMTAAGERLYSRQCALFVCGSHSRHLTKHAQRHCIYIIKCVLLSIAFRLLVMLRHTYSGFVDLTVCCHTWHNPRENDLWHEASDRIFCSPVGKNTSIFFVGRRLKGWTDKLTLPLHSDGFLPWSWLVAIQIIGFFQF